MLNFDQFRLVSFDCYGTLIDWETGIFSALRPLLAAHGKTIADAELLRLYSELESQTPNAESTVLTWKFCGRWCAASASISDSCRPNPRYARCPTRCPTGSPFRTRSRRCASSRPLPAGGHLQCGRRSFRLDGTPYSKYPSTYVVTAQQARAYKPSLSIFQLAQQRTGVLASQWLHVAQSLYHDVTPANLSESRLSG